MRWHPRHWLRCKASKDSETLRTAADIHLVTDPQRHHQDRLLVERALAGSSEALDEVFDRMRCVPRMLAATNRRFGAPLDEHELADASQEAITVLWKKLSTFSGESLLETWAYQVSVHVYWNSLRKRRRLPVRASDQDADVDFAESAAATESAAPPESEKLQRALSNLDAEDATILRLKHFSEFTFDQIAERFSWSPNTVKTRYYRAVTRLRGLLAGAQGENAL